MANGADEVHYVVDTGAQYRPGTTVKVIKMETASGPHAYVEEHPDGPFDLVSYEPSDRAGPNGRWLLAMHLRRIPGR